MSSAGKTDDEWIAELEHLADDLVEARRVEALASRFMSSEKLVESIAHNIEFRRGYVEAATRMDYACGASHAERARATARRQIASIDAANRIMSEELLRRRKR